MSTASLYYHDCRGRGEAIRLALHDRLGWDAVGDERLTRETRRSERWATELKQSPVTGPFGTLPVLTIDGIQISQVVAIAAYLVQRLDAPALPEFARSMEVISAAYTDVISPILALLWGAERCPGADVDALIVEVWGKIGAVLKRLDRLLGAADATPGGARHVLGSPEPSIADYFLLDASDVALGLAGPAVFNAESLPHLHAHRASMLARPGLRKYLESERRSPSVSFSPVADVVTARARELVRL